MECTVVACYAIKTSIAENPYLLISADIGIQQVRHRLPLLKTRVNMMISSDKVYTHYTLYALHESPLIAISTDRAEVPDA
jgi:hypothetical protein